MACSQSFQLAMYHIFNWICPLLLVCCPAPLKSSENLDFLLNSGEKYAKKYAQLCQRLEKIENYEPEGPNDGQFIPEIYDTMWPYFCLNHLINDPKGCSCWKSDDEGNLELEFLRDGNSLAWIDTTLIERIGEKWRLFPKNTSAYDTCDHGHCTICGDTIIRDYYHPETLGYGQYRGWSGGDGLMLYRCSCLKAGEWHRVYVGELEHHNTFGKYCKAFKKKIPQWHFCTQHSIFPGYFNWSYQTYFPFFEQFLSYLDTNRTCTCYWPHCLNWASNISFTASLVLEWLADFTSLKQEMKAKKFSPYLNYSINAEFARGLIIHAYFYSQYYQIFHAIDQFSSTNLPSAEHQIVHQNLLAATDEMIRYFQMQYTKCLKKHPHPKIYYERGMLHFHTGAFLESFDDIRQWIAYAEANNLQSFLTSDLYLQEGRLLNELLCYDEAITSLTKAIQKDPQHKEAFFERAVAYFETGNLQCALSDYLTSDMRPTFLDDPNYQHFVFSIGVGLGCIKGGCDSAVHFVASCI